LGKYNGIIGYFDKVLAIDPNDPVVLNHRGISLINLGNYSGAITYYDKALAIRPNYATALDNKNKILDLLGKQ
jgi:tetratricopeptide (TPR) repeat protein